VLPFKGSQDAAAIASPSALASGQSVTVPDGTTTLGTGTLSTTDDVTMARFAPARQAVGSHAITAGNGGTSHSTSPSAVLNLTAGPRAGRPTTATVSSPLSMQGGRVLPGRQGILGYQPTAAFALGSFGSQLESTKTTSPDSAVISIQTKAGLVRRAALEVHWTKAAAQEAGPNGASSSREVHDLALSKLLRNEDQQSSATKAKG
jgi:hypothetical protein